MIAPRYAWLVALVAGVALALSFPPYGFWPLAVLGVALLTFATFQQRLRWGLVTGFVAGLAQFAVLIRWLDVVGVDAWLMLTAYSAMWIGGVGVATAAVTRLRWWPLWVAVIWVAQEALRDRIPLGGWPWGRLAFSQSDAPWLVLSWWGGTAALTFAVTLAGSVLLWAALSGRARPVAASAALVGVVVAPFALSLAPTVATTTGSSVVAVVQGDVPATGLGFAVAGQRRAVLDNHVSETIRLAERVRSGQVPQPDLVIWPENASDLDPYTARDAAVAISTAARAIGVPILVGAVVTNPADPQTVLNVGIVWDPVTGPGERYVKQHPVPFGEYVPFRDVLTRVIGRFDLVPRDFAAGDAPGVLQMGEVVVGDVICFEVAYDEIVRGTVLAGAQLLAVQTNNATYTGGGQSEQQVAMARIRAVETGRATVVAATNGISAQFLPDGTMVGMLPEQTAGSLVADLPLVDTVSPATVLGAWPEWVAVVSGVVAFAMGVRRSGNPARAPAPAARNNDAHD